MRSYMFVRIVMFLALAFSGLGKSQLTAPVATQNVQAILHSQVSAYSLKADDFAHALISLSARFNLPMGIEWVRSPETTKRFNLSWSDTSVEQMLKTLVESQPGYQFEISDGIVHVFPSSINSSAQNFLNFKIDKFELRNQVVETASHKLRDLVRLRVSPPKSATDHGAGVGYSQAANIGDPEFSMALENVSVRQVLDSLATASNKKIWVVTFVSSKDVTPTGYLRTITLRNDTGVPDSEQPVWDMFG